MAATVLDDGAPHTRSSRQRDERVMALCAALFERPDLLALTLTHPVDTLFTIAPHTHENVLQFDLLLNCAGKAYAQGQWQTLSRASAMVAGPGEEHGYELLPRGGEDPDAPARVYHFQIAADGLPEGVVEAFPRLVTGWRDAQTLASAMRVVARLGAVAGVRRPLLMARLAEGLCLWPPVTEAGRDAGPATPGSVLSEPEEYERGMAAAVELIEQRVADPPSLTELAEVAHFSGRHFSRRFHAVFGCTPHAYMTARRFALAQQMLSQERLQVQEIAEQLGFGSVATFSRWFSQQAGQSPTAFRENPQVL